MVGLLQRCVDCGRRISGGDQILSWRICHHLLPVIVELRGWAISQYHHAQLVRPLESNLGLCGESEGMTLAARTFIEMYRRKFHRARGGEPAAGCFQNIECLLLK